MAQTTLRDYLQITEDAISSGNVSDALANCQRILTHFPEMLEAQRLLGEVYLAQGHLEEAQHTFDWVLTNDPENVIAYCSRALVNERMEEYDTALDCYQQAYELSRGNSQIRQEFNQLSARIGQQGFIFSRAGLARLYMRGDLLPQSIQEWETVLAISPERLDVRTGLLEAYWREELYDRVEQLATQILEDVPGCLKALLLLAHVTFAQNALQAQELMQRARALDPDLVMAQDLFSDFMVSQVKDPFLTLLKKAPTVIPETSNGQYETLEPAELQASTATGRNGTLSTSTFSDPLVRWSSLDNIIEPQQDYQTMQDTPSFGTWTNNSSAGLEPWNPLLQQNSQPLQELPTQSNQPHIHQSEFDAWSAFSQLDEQPTLESPAAAMPTNSTPGQAVWSDFDQQLRQPAQAETTGQSQSANDGPGFDSSNVFSQVDAPTQPEATATRSNDSTVDFDSWNNFSPDADASSSQEPWHMQQVQPDVAEQSEATSLQEQNNAEQPQPWYHMDTFAGSTADAWSVANPLEATSAPASWEVDEKATDRPAPPAWLDMLTKNERPQSGGNLSRQSSMPSPGASEPLDVMVKPSALQQEVSDVPTSPTEEEKNEASITATLPPLDDEEAFFFGPEWLKSLGATSIDSPSSLKEETPAPLALKPALQPGVDKTQAPASEQVADALVTPSALVSEPTLDWTSSLLSEATTPPEQLAIPELSVAPELSEQPGRAQNDISVAVWLEQAARKLEQSEQNVHTTLEELENDLRSQGFMPLEPGALSSMSQENSEPSLSAALAQLGDLTPQSTDKLQSVQPLQQETASAAEILWPTTTTSNSLFSEAPLTADNRQQDGAPMPVSHLDALSNYVSRSAPQLPSSATPESGRVEALSNLVSNNLVSGSTFHTPDAPAAYVPAAPTLQPVVPLDVELETTMKRPVMRLQPMQQRPVAIQRDQAQITANGQSGNHSTTSKALERNGSYKDRLLTGYQYQLAGSYDDAMQEYRVIIRNAPELLGEVVSNMRALLKLAPKYAVGYRVLGDAYMRQGEYLQAMEAYNKALTMAKKAKS
ncbi:MAG: hypothetical protein NVSMB33_12710 [Ktedonobacteraceae bacterium]